MNSLKRKRYYFWYITARFLNSQRKIHATAGAASGAVDDPKALDRDVVLGAIKGLVNATPEVQVKFLQAHSITCALVLTISGHQIDSSLWQLDLATFRIKAFMPHVGPVWRK